MTRSARQNASVVVVLAVLGGVGYAVGVRRLTARGRRWPATRSAPFAAGVVVLAVFSELGVGRDSAARFSTHMVEHVAVGMVAPLLLALGAPVTLALQTAAPRPRAVVRRALHSRAASVATYPLVAWALFGLTPFVLYFTPLLDASVRSGAVHAAVHLHLLAAGCLFCWPAVGLDPIGHRLPHGARVLYVFVAVPFHAVLGVALLSARTPLSPGATIADQHAAAGIVWAAGDLFGVAATAVALLHWMAADDRAAARADRFATAASAPAPPAPAQPVRRATPPSR